LILTLGRKHRLLDDTTMPQNHRNALPFELGEPWLLRVVARFIRGSWDTIPLAPRGLIQYRSPAVILDQVLDEGFGGSEHAPGKRRTKRRRAFLRQGRLPFLPSRHTRKQSR